MTDLIWKAPTVALTEYSKANLNALGVDDIQLETTVIDNETTNLRTHMDLEMMLGSVDWSSQVAPAIWIYLIESVDGGTDFDTASDEAAWVAGEEPPFSKICAIMDFRPYTGAEAKVIVKSMIPIPPGNFKLAIRNKSGVALAASSTTNILSYRTYSLNNV